MTRNLQQLVNQLPAEWQTLLEPFAGELLSEIQSKIDQDATRYEGLGIYPKPEHTLRAFHYQPPDQIKVVIIGQDCYHQPDQAIGLCFGVLPGTNLPPSLINIKRELKSDLQQDLTNFELTHWAEQGVLLLNSALTVRQASPGSHLPYWKSFTNEVIRALSKTTNNVVFLLWGKYAKSKESLIDTNRGHLILKANHPSPLSANRGGWFGTRHFSQTNEYLSKVGKSSIQW